MAASTSNGVYMVPVGERVDPKALTGVPTITKAALNLLPYLSEGKLDLTLPDGRRFQFGGAKPGPEAEILIKDYGIAWRVLSKGHLGAAESYLNNEWETPNLTAFLEFFVSNRQELDRRLRGHPFFRAIERFAHHLRRNSKSGSRKNIHAHYDLGNAFYEKWLDTTMTYSSAKFGNQPNLSLEAAQTEKYRSLAEQIGLTPHHHVLEIGCGWGGFAEFAAREIGCQVTGITISQEQFDFANARMQSQELQDKVDIQFLDYRDLEGSYDRIVSIEMFEAVGMDYWPSYFSQVRDRLKPGGQAGLQIITIDDDTWPVYRTGADFIQRYIFPGGMLPAPSVLKQEVMRAGLDWKNSLTFGRDYAETLRRWQNSFQTAWPEIVPLGFDDRFRRMWEYYLSYCEAGFRNGNIDVAQITLARPG